MDTNKFNEDQLSAIMHVKGPALVIAGPGSGKTTVMLNRIAYLIENKYTLPENILAVTFTKAAAEEMRSRFLKLELEGDSKYNKNDVTFGTFHSVFFEILRKHTVGTRLTLIERNDSIKALKELLSIHYPDLKPTGDFILSLISEFSCIKNGVKHPAPGSLSTVLLPLYDKKIHKKGLIDFDDMLLLCLRLLKKDERVLSTLRKQYKFIMLDEFQDINRLQFQIIRLISEPLNNIFAVGDDDQSIYRFRGSDPSIMLSFKKYYPNAENIILRTNYRSNASIVGAALKLIEHNKNRYKKDLRAFNTERAEIDICGFKNVFHEMNALRQSLYNVKDGRSIAILFRTHRAGAMVKQLLDFENELMKMNISLMTFHASKGLEFDEVYIVNANENITPGLILDTEVLEEERRMFYVAVTRARHILHIFFTKSFYNTQSKRSRFVFELH